MTKQDLLEFESMIIDRKEDLKKVDKTDFVYPRLSNELNALENALNFISEAYEIAYGDSAIDKNYSSEEVLQCLQDFSDDAYTYESKYKYKNNM